MPGIEIAFQEAQIEHAVAFLDFMSKVATETDFLAMDEGGLPLLEQEMAAILDKTQAAPDQLCLLALNGEEVIGAVTVRTSRQAKLAHIGDVFIAIRKDYWGQGIGKLLLEEVVYWAEHFAHLARLELTVQVRNHAAVHLYQSLGFDIEGTKKRGALSQNGEFLDVYMMGRLIDEVTT